MSFEERSKYLRLLEYKVYGWWKVLFGALLEENYVYVGNIKVFRLNDFDWVAACALEEAIEWYLVCCESIRDEVIDEPAEVPLSTKMRRDSYCDDLDVEVTFKQQIRYHMNQGNAFPMVIASMEY